MRRFFLLFLFVCFGAVACGNSPTTVTSGDSTADAASDQTEAVADDSAPVATSPSTTAPWAVTLDEFPLLTLVDDQGRGGDVWLGSASFLLVNQDGMPTFSGGDKNPEFLVKLSAYLGVENDVEFTINSANVNTQDSDENPEYRLCGGQVAWLAPVGDNQFRRVPNQLPQIRGSELAWDGEGFAPSGVPGQFISLFDQAVVVDVAADGSGFTITPANGDGDPHRFTKLDPPAPAPSPPVTANVATTTTIVVEEIDN